MLAYDYLLTEREIKMYKFIKAKPVHSKQVLDYLTKTCYWKELVYENTQNKNYEDFMLEWIVNPRLPFTTVLVKEGEEDKVRGCIITFTTDELAKMPDCSPYIHPNAIKAFAPWFSFSPSDGVMIDLIFVDKELRGQGYGYKLFQVAEELAKTEKKTCLSLFIWAFFPDSLINAIRSGCMIKACIDFPGVIDLPLLYVERKSEYAKLKDYFQSEKYLNVPNVLLA